MHEIQQNGCSAKAKIDRSKSAPDEESPVDAERPVPHQICGGTLSIAKAMLLSVLLSWTS